MVPTTNGAISSPMCLSKLNAFPSIQYLQIAWHLAISRLRETTADVRRRTGGSSPISWATLIDTTYLSDHSITGF